MKTSLMAIMCALVLWVAAAMPARASQARHWVAPMLVGLFDDAGLDCNTNGNPDDEDILNGESEDCNTSGVPDECEIGPVDCNTNGTIDACDLASGESQDCNTNARPDRCDIAFGSVDCDTNGVPDRCELAGRDCNNNNNLDVCDIASGSALDCNTNTFPDQCDIAAGRSLDVDHNGRPDECEPSPDLTLNSVTAPPTASDNAPAQISWEVDNIGTGTANGPWADRVYMSRDNALDTNVDTLVGTFIRTSPLAPTDPPYTRTESVTVPAGFNGLYYFIVFTDALANVTERGGETNNVRAAATPTTVNQDSLPDLVVGTITPSGLLYVNQTLTLSYRVNNIGPGTANGNWLDRVYLSTDSVFNPTGQNPDMLVSQLSIVGLVGPGGFYVRSTQFVLPQVPGGYYIFIQLDPGETLDEADNGNNLQSQLLVIGEPEYDVIVSTEITNAPANTAIPMTGSAANYSDGSPAANRPVAIDVTLRGFRRTYSATTNAQGIFNYTFHPLAAEAGVFTISSRHPAADDAGPQDIFTLYGMSSAPNGVTVNLVPTQTVMGTLAISNLGDTPLTGITASTIDVPANMMLSATPPSSIAALATVSVPYQIVATNNSVPNATPALRLQSAEGAVVTINFQAHVVPAIPMLEVNPAALESGMVLGETRYVEFNITNVGGAATGSLNIVLPGGAPWMRLVTPAIMPALSPGQQASVTLSLQPPTTLLTGPYNGTIQIQSTGLNQPVPFTFTAVSNGRGDIRVRATDEATYFAPGLPPLANAVVTVLGAYSNAQVGQTTTGADGIALFTNLPEAAYRVRAQAENHGTFETVVYVRATEVQELDAFLTMSTVNYQWTVEPTYTADRYRINIEALFQTNVPAPVITVEPNLVDLRTLPVGETIIPFVITNHGLIAAQDMSIGGAGNDEFEIEPLVTDFGDLAGGGASVTAYVRFHRRQPDSPGSDPCIGVRLEVRYFLVCGVRRAYTVPVSFIIDPARCPPIFPGGGGGGGGTFSCPGCGGGIFVPPPIVHADPCDPCVAKCLKSMAECGLSFIPILNCPYQLYNNCQHPFASVRDFVVCVVDGIAGGCLPLPPIVNVAQCICTILRDCVIAPAQQCRMPSIPCSAADVFDLLEGRGGNPDPLLAYLDVQYQNLILFARPVVTVLGSAQWLNGAIEDSDTLRDWLAAFAMAAGDGTDQGITISAAERVALMQLPLPAHVNAALANTFLDRFNRTIDYWSQGIFTIGQVPPGQSTDFIDRDFLNAQRAEAIAANEAGELEGHGGPFEAVDYAMGVLQHDRMDQSAGICARVRVQISQEAVISRSAFRATLQLENAGTVPLQNIRVNVQVRDLAGADANALFDIPEPALTNISDVNGNGQIAGGNNARAIWTITPSDFAAPAENTRYTVGGEVIYTLNGQTLTIPLYPATITVMPNPSMHLKYFLERRVYSDDPFTPEIEPAVPFSLGLIASNLGAGVANDFTITSAQPQITENEQGLVISFRIIGTQVGAQPVSPSLTVNLGDFLPNVTKVAQWLLTCSLEGRFVTYQATYEHIDGRNEPQFSLIDSIDIFEMIHVVRMDRGSDDALPDFLTNQTPDPDALPDRVHSSTGEVLTVVPVMTSQIDGPPTANDLEVALTANMPAGWSYLRLNDPGARTYRLIRVLRSNGTEVPFGHNAWTTQRVVRPAQGSPYNEDLVHIFDFNSTGTYTLIYDACIPPVFTMQEQATRSFNNGQNASLSVAANPGTGALTYRWRRNGLGLFNGGRISGAFGPTLSINPIFQSDGGVYDCVITNGCTTLTSTPTSVTVTGQAQPNGDMNGNGRADGDDVAAFITALYSGSTAPGDLSHADFNGNGMIDAGDLTPFVQAVLAGQ